MLKKGRKREAKGLAVLYFIIGLIILLIILVVIYFALYKLDYSDKVEDPETIRSFVEEQDQQNSDVVPEYVMPEDEVDLTGGLEDLPEEDQLPPAEEPTQAPTDVPTPEPEPEPEATPEPEPEPTPEPTALPTDKVAHPLKKEYQKKLEKLPDAASENGMIGITSCYISQPDGNKLMVLTGYGYVNEESYDAAQANMMLVITQASTGKNIGYELNRAPGITGLAHPAAVCQNPNSSDFETILDVSKYDEGVYYLSLVITYKSGGKNVVKYYPFGNDISFNVLDHSVVSPVNASTIE